MLFSGDKLLGGPQCGIMAGTRKAIDRVESDPLMRALRLDKMTLAALEATLRLALDPERGAARIPLWSMVAAPVDVLSERATAIAGDALRSIRLSGAGRAGGFVPGRRQRSDPADSDGGDRDLAAVSAARISRKRASRRRFGEGDPPVIVRVQKGIVLLDLRTIPASSEADLLDALGEVCHDRGGKGTGNGPPAVRMMVEPSWAVIRNV